MSVQLLRGVVQHYEWGDQQAIPNFLHTEADARPWAELWFGTHRSGPSLVKTPSGSQPLSSYAGELSFLVKIIAAAKPLSLQTHPTDEQAASGYQQENEIGISQAFLGIDLAQQALAQGLAKAKLAHLNEFTAQHAA